MGMSYGLLARSSKMFESRLRVSLDDFLDLRNFRDSLKADEF